MFFGAPFEIFDLTLVYPERSRGAAYHPAAPVWLTPFFSQPSVLPLPFTPICEGQLLSFDNHLDWPRVKFAILTPRLFPAHFASCLFSVVCTLFAQTGAPNFVPTSFFSFACALLQKQWGVYPFAHCFPLAFSASPRRYTIESASPRHSRDSSPRFP